MTEDLQEQVIELLEREHGEAAGCAAEELIEGLAEYFGLTLENSVDLSREVEE